MEIVKKILSKYTALVWALLKPLGAWGIFVASALDGAAIGLPVDAIVGGYVYANHSRLLLYVFMASAGSVFGSIVVYAIGYAGGEELLRKRIPQARFEKIHRAFDKHPFWSLMFPAMLPPPTPFKLFALAAAASEMGFLKYVLAIFCGRIVRFFVLALLILKLGPEFVHGLGTLFRLHLSWLWVVLAAGLFVAVFTTNRRRRKRKTQKSPDVSEKV